MAEKRYSPFHMVVSLLVFLFVVVSVIRPIKIPLPAKWTTRDRWKRWHLPTSIVFDFGTTPLLGVLVLLITTVMTPQELLIGGIVGEDNEEGGIHPYAIIIIFFTLAYLSISLDLTGVFEYIAIKTLQKAKGSVTKMFVTVFALSSVLTVFTSNDIVILTVTPIICYLSHHAGIDPIPLLFVQFFAANIWSISLVIGNPTNIIVAEAYALSFLQYSAWMMLPAIASGLTCLCVTYLVFRRRILDQQMKDLPPFDPRSFIKYPKFAFCGTAWLLLCLVLLMCNTWISIPLYAITLLFGGVMFVGDIMVDTMTWREHRRKRKYEGIILHQKVFEEPNSGNEHSDGEEIAVASGDTTNKPIAVDGEHVDTIVHADDHTRQPADVESPASTPLTDGTHRAAAELSEKHKSRYRVVEALSRMPWRILPFVIGMFTLVEALEVVGWLDLFGNVLAGVAKPGIAAAVFGVGGLSTIACNLVNNQPMTILFTETLQTEAFEDGVANPTTRMAAMFALIMGSNFGANLTLIGALAGIMWSSILADKGVKVTYFQFAKYGSIVMTFVVAVGCAVLTIEFLVVG